jgi:general L-amino acid transport system permease protein
VARAFPVTRRARAAPIQKDERMADVPDPRRDGFHLSQLINDSRYRSLTIQAVAMILLVSAMAWLFSNVAQNLDALGRGFSFSFLRQPAGYDINQRLIPFTAQDSHARAGLVGILNTLLVAVLGCILATVIGVLAGVLRLSRNWIVARLMAIYVEGFRNVPLLIWILLIYAIFTESTPQPRDFRPDETGVAKASMILWDTVAVTNRGIYVPRPVWGEGAWLLALVLAASIAGALWWRRRARKVLYDEGRMIPVAWPVLAILILPVSVAFLALGRPLTFTVPELGGFNFTGGVQVLNSFMALWLALSLYTGAFIAEIVRAGILAISRGQTEAAYALGLRPGRTMSLVILPQALRVIIPPLISQYLNLTKNSSLAVAVGYMDVRSTLGGTAITTTGKELEGMLLIGLFYLVASLVIAAVMNVYNSSVRLKER